MIGLTVLGLLYYNQMNLQGADGAVDFEKILPATINSFFACWYHGSCIDRITWRIFMGTFSGTLNAAQAYIVNDIYLKYVNPELSTKKIITANYLVGIAVVTIGVVLWILCKECK